MPIGTYELTELTAPSGYVVNGSEQTVTDISEGRENGYKITDTPQRKLTFTINNGSVYPDGQMGENKYAVCDQYGNLTVTVLQKNQGAEGNLTAVQAWRTACRNKVGGRDRWNDQT